MAKRIVNKAERNAERYDAKETGYQLYEDSLKGNKFDRLMPLIVSEQNIILAYRNIFLHFFLLYLQFVLP